MDISRRRLNGRLSCHIVEVEVEHHTTPQHDIPAGPPIYVQFHGLVRENQHRSSSWCFNRTGKGRRRVKNKTRADGAGRTDRRVEVEKKRPIHSHNLYSSSYLHRPCRAGHGLTRGILDVYVSIQCMFNRHILGDQDIDDQKTGV